jgi:23S rRNA pseudouridine1911/1915/1917 synthase
VGDPAYGTRRRLPAGAQAPLLAALRNLKRQALHAMRLEFQNPSGRGQILAESPLPEDITGLLAALGDDTAAAGGA